MPIRWKVVRKIGRRSYIVSPDSKYSIEYIKGTTVKENKEGLGIMCFETKELARKFGRSGLRDGRVILIKVNGIGRGKKIKRVACIHCGCILELYIKLRDAYRETPEGTICYKSVEVLT